MSKEKKSSTTKRHIKEKCIKWKRKVAELKMEKQAIYQDLTSMREENQRLKDEKSALEQMNHELLELHGLSKKVEKLIAIYHL